MEDSVCYDWYVPKVPGKMSMNTDYAEKLHEVHQKFSLVLPPEYEDHQIRRHHHAIQFRGVWFVSDPLLPYLPKDAPIKTGFSFLNSEHLDSANLQFPCVHQNQLLLHGVKWISL